MRWPMQWTTNQSRAPHHRSVTAVCSPQRATEASRSASNYVSKVDVTSPFSLAISTLREAFSAVIGVVPTDRLDAFYSAPRGEARTWLMPFSSQCCLAVASGRS